MPTRREFLRLAGGTTALVGTGLWATLVRDQVAAAASRAPGAAAGDGTERYLVIVEMDGANDALNTLVPLDGRYHDLRPELGLADETLLRPAGFDGHGLHPALAPLGALAEAGQLAAVARIGFAAATRSHFQAMDTWWAGTGQAGVSPTGWLGRWLDATGGDGSEGSPAANPLRAVAVGGTGRALRAERALATAVSSPTGFRLRAPRGTRVDAFAAALEATAAPVSDDASLATSQRAVANALGALDGFAAAVGEDPGGGATGFTGSLDVAADLLTAGLGTRVVLVQGSGFDTHAGQAATHERLLADVAGGIAALFERLGAAGMAERTLVITTSEFGRRCQENASAGTDHGSGGAAFAAGPGVAGGLRGAMDLGDLVEGDLRVAVDARGLYAAALGWLGGPVDEVLGTGFEDLGLLR